MAKVFRREIFSRLLNLQCISKCQYQQSHTNFPIGAMYVRHLSVGCHVSSKSMKPTDASSEPPIGKIYDKKPVKVVLEAGKLYSWCTCGLSKKQPFCDGSHKTLNEGDVKLFRSHKFQVDETKEIYLCNCKQTKHRPFCDGEHKLKWIQDATI